MKTVIVNKIRQTDYFLNSAYLGLWGEKKSLIIFLFHVIFRDERESRSHAVQPAQGMNLRHFSQLIEYYQGHHYHFISPDDILNGLDSNKNHALITFDDGYYNNRHVLPILKQHKIPALFFISTDYVKNNKAFWWDVLYREKIKRGMSSQEISEEITSWTWSKTNEEIQRYITDEFGKETLVPIGDIDRPFSPLELRDFSKEGFVFLGNHTSQHPYLPNCSPDEISSTILAAQNDLYDMTASHPAYISYPHGAYSKDVINITKQIGFKLGMTVDDRKNYLPINFQSDDPLCLGRFVLQDNSQLIEQCQLCRTDIRLTKIIKGLMGKA